VTKVYRAAEGFSAVFAHDVERALSGLSRGFGESQTNRARPLLRCEIPPQLCNPRVEILAPITRAIHLRRPVQVRYSSFTSGELTREIVPFALANNGLRWHVRAFDRRRREFIDFVLTRIHEVCERATGRIEEHELSEHDLECGTRTGTGAGSSSEGGAPRNCRNGLQHDGRGAQGSRPGGACKLYATAMDR